MKAIVVPVLMFLVATQAFSKWVLLLEFSLNRDYIAANLCENRAKPKLNCGGKCQLMKKMADEEKDSSQQPQNAKVKFQEVLFPFDQTLPDDRAIVLQTVSAWPHLLVKKYTAPPLSIFHPPV